MALFLIVTLDSSCGTSAAAAVNPIPLRIEVLQTLPHDQELFTQGLAVQGNILYESGGIYGKSSLSSIDLRTHSVTAKAKLPGDQFGEGIAVVGGKVWQLTWREGQALEWNVKDLKLLGHRNYSGEGWGLCYDGKRLIISDGSSTLTFRDPETFAVLDKVQVARAGVSVSGLNALECSGGKVWANVWGSDEILSIDPATGAVAAVADASSLVRGVRNSSPDADILNGIAIIPGTDDFLLTGKLWPTMFRVKIRP